VRSPRTMSSAGTYREPILILAQPAAPTLGQLWDGKASVEVLGPAGLPIRLSVSLQFTPGKPAIRKEFHGLRLPVDRSTWVEVFDEEFRQKREVWKRYED